MKHALSTLIIFLIAFLYPGFIFAEQTYSIVDIAPISNIELNSDYSNFPTGNVLFNKIPFQISSTGKNFLATHNQACLSCPQVVSLDNLSLSSAKSVWILINSSNTFSPSYTNVNFGSVYLGFNSESQFRYDFIAGNNVREWMQSGNHGLTVNTVTSPLSQEVWRGVRPTGEGPIVTDLLKISIPQEYNHLVLQKITIADESIGRLSTSNPGLIIKGITVEHGTYSSIRSLSISTNWDEEQRQMPVDRSADIAVKVVDQDGVALADIPVSAEVVDAGKGSLDRTNALSVENGEAHFVFTPSSVGDVRLKFSLDGVSQEITLHVYRPPIVIIPDMGASLSVSRMIQNLSGSADWKWGVLSQYGWDGVVGLLETNGYVKDVDYAIAFYDWRKSLDPSLRASGKSTAVEDSLLPAITKVMTNRSAGQKVNLLSHGYGGLVMRSLVQGTDAGNINRVLSFGTPHGGSADGFYMWYGGTMSPTGDPSLRMMADILVRLSKYVNPNDGIGTVRTKFPSFKHLLPLYDEYVQIGDIFTPTNQLKFTNDALTSFLQNDAFVEAVHTKDIAYSSFHGIGNSTVRSIDVQPPVINAKIWEDGKPFDLLSSYSSGDGSVLSESVQIAGLNSSRVNASHGDLPDGSMVQLKNILKLSNAADAGTASVKRLLGALLLSPATVQIISPAGSVLGYSQEISPDGAKFAYTSDLSKGLYTLRVTGTGTGNYVLYVPYGDLDSWSTAEFSGSTKKGKVDEYFVYLNDSPESMSKITTVPLRITVGNLDIRRKQLDLAFVFDLPKNFDAAQLDLSNLLVNGEEIPVISSRVSKNERKLYVDVNGALVGKVVKWDDRELVLKAVVPGSLETLQGQLKFKLNWSLYRRFF